MNPNLVRTTITFPVLGIGQVSYEVCNHVICRKGGFPILRHGHALRCARPLGHKGNHKYFTSGALNHSSETFFEVMRAAGIPVN
jgi:hypothetical protein